MCGDSWQQAREEVLVFTSSSAFWAYLTPLPCPLYVFGQQGQWSAVPLPLTRSHQKVALPAPILKAQGRAAGRESARRQGTRAPQSPRASTPSPGHHPSILPELGRPHLGSLASAFPGWVPRLAQPRGSCRRGWHLETSCRFLSAQSLSFPLSRPPSPDSTRCPVKGVHAGPARGSGARRPNNRPQERSHRPDTQRQNEPASPQVCLGVGGESVGTIRDYIRT